LRASRLSGYAGREREPGESAQWSRGPSASAREARPGSLLQFSSGLRKVRRDFGQADNCVYRPRAVEVPDLGFAAHALAWLARVISGKGP
jgi:hypothetical protein